MAADRRSGRGGFTLIEALVAFTILAMLALVVQRGVVTAANGLARARDQVAAERVARTLLAEPVTSDGRRTGVTAGLRWTMTVEPLDLPAVAGPQLKEGVAPARWQPVRVAVEVGMGNGRSLLFDTVRLAGSAGR